MAGSAWSNQLDNLIILSAAQSGFSGFFTYSPAPGAGNLVASLAAVQGTDPYGNAYLAGTVGYFNTGANFTAVQLGTSQEMGFYTAPTEAGPWTQVAAIGAASADLVLSSNRYIIANEMLRPPDPVTPTNPESWHQITTVGGMTINAGGHIAYRLTIDNQVEMEVQNVTASSQTDGTTVVTAANGLPAPYRPTGEKRRPLAYAVTKSTAGAYPGATFAIQTDGSIQCYGFATADRIDGEFRYPLDI